VLDRPGGRGDFFKLALFAGLVFQPAAEPKKTKPWNGALEKITPPLGGGFSDFFLAGAPNPGGGEKGAFLLSF